MVRLGTGPARALGGHPGSPAWRPPFRSRRSFQNVTRRRRPRSGARSHNQKPESPGHLPGGIALRRAAPRRHPTVTGWGSPPVPGAAVDGATTWPPAPHEGAQDQQKGQQPRVATSPRSTAAQLDTAKCQVRAVRPDRWVPGVLVPSDSCGYHSHDHAAAGRVYGEPVIRPAERRRRLAAGK